MKILLIGHRNRGRNCLEVLYKKHEIVGVVANFEAGKPNHKNDFVELAREYGLPVFSPEDINDSKNIQIFKNLQPDIIAISGYSQIIKKDLISLSEYGCINLHGGKLPEQRGSSPMNWVLINGEKSFSISVIQIDEGVDTGDVLLEKKFSIDINDTIVDLHRKANEAFPGMLLEAIEHIDKGTLQSKKQDESKASYYPLRFSSDGLIIWDQLTAEEIHNRIRALTRPYPCAFTYYKKQKVKLLKSSLTTRPFYGESGRIYRKKDNKFLICAKDRCLWIEKAEDVDTRKNFYLEVKKYEQLITIKGTLRSIYEGETRI